jgi:hypothetical protein
VLTLLGASPSVAQQARFAPIAVDSDVSIDHSVDDSGNTATNLILDAVGSIRLTNRFEALTRPYLQRSPSGEWNWQVWVAEIRYERPGPIGVRVDAGLIPSPVGYANLLLRPHLNPTIALPASLFQALPQVQPAGPRATLLGAVYADGVSVTVSGRHWDARTAIIDTSPLRTRRTFYSSNPPRFANVVAGAGVTPFVGFRVGAAVTHGGWQRAGESPAITRDRDATIVNVESEFSYRYTQIAGEWTRDLLQTSIDDEAASGWFIQARQTLAPRWFVAGRVERIAAGAVTATGARLPQRLRGVEEVVGFRVTPEITVRAGHRARAPYGRDEFVHNAEVSVVWSKRWF